MNPANHCQFIGNLTADPQFYEGEGKNGDYQKATFRIGVTTKGKNWEDTVFVNVTAWGNQAQTIVKYFSKGDSILVCGQYETEEYEDKKTGDKRLAHRFKLDQFKFVSQTKKQRAKSNGEDNDEDDEPTPPPKKANDRKDKPKANGKPSKPAPPPVDDDDDDDEGDIPFE